MITLIVLFAVIATVAVTINLGLLAFVVYLSKQRKRALKAVDQLNNAVYSLSVDKAFLLAKQQSTVLWSDKGSETIH